MRRIELTQGKFALVDDSDFDALNAHKWNAYAQRNTWYAKRWVRFAGGRRVLRMHNAVLSAPAGMIVDHQNGDGLDNTRSNLRAVTHQQNNWNQTHKAKGTTSRFRGVCWVKSHGKWHAQINIGQKIKHLGFFTDEFAAAAAYDVACISRDAEHCCPNFSASFLAPTVRP